MIFSEILPLRIFKADFVVLEVFYSGYFLGDGLLQSVTFLDKHIFFFRHVYNLTENWNHVGLELTSLTM